jgi:cyclase
MPLCYGGGVTNVEQVKRIIGLGVEKVAISAAAVARPGLIGEFAHQVGRQSVVAVIDVKKAGLMRRFEVHTHNGTRRTGLDPVELAKRFAHEGAGEIVINNIDRDGAMTGYDLELIDRIVGTIGTPLTIVGGAGSQSDLAQAVGRYGVIGLGAGSLFVFKGRLRAVLVSYPDAGEKQRIFDTPAAHAGTH